MDDAEWLETREMMQYPPPLEHQVLPLLACDVLFLSVMIL